MSTDANKLLYQIALTRIKGVGDIIARNLLAIVGDEEAIFRSSPKSLQNIKGLPKKLVNAILDPSVLKEAEAEMYFIEKNNIEPLFINSLDYPSRLRECADAPILLYNKGNVNLNTSHIISIVGTRNATHYGNTFCESFLKEIAEAIPDVLIVSGLAYGIDIQSHRCALASNLPTVGVLAHGLDRIYPAAHRQTAIEMIKHGGLLTEFPSKTEPDRYNFVRRNRIVAGMADALIVVESDLKGGSLITAEIASSYCKDIFATPGRIGDPKSAGCNNLIATHKADIFFSTQQFLEQMGWNNHSVQSKRKPRQPKLFDNFTQEEQLVINKLATIETIHIDQLAREVNIPAYQLFSILLELEMKGVIKNMPGNMFGLI